MADVAKYQPIPNGKSNLSVSDFKGPIFLFKTRKSSTFVYGIVLVFVVFTIFLAFASSSSSSPWFINIFTVNSTSPTFSDESYRSHFSSIFSYFFPNSTQVPQFNPSRSQIITNYSLPTSLNLTKTPLPPDKGQILKPNQTIVDPSYSTSEVGSPENQKNAKKERENCREETCSSEKQSNQTNITIPQISQAPENPALRSGNSSKNGGGNKDSEVGYQQNQKLEKDKKENPRNETYSSEKQSNQSSKIPQISSNFSANSSIGSSDLSKNGDGKEEIEVGYQQNQKIEKDKRENLRNETKNSEKRSNESSKIPQISSNFPSNSSIGSSNSSKNVDGKNEKGVKEKVAASDFAASLSKKQSGHGNGTVSEEPKEKLVSSLVGCDLYDGEWVRDDSYPLYKPGSCSFIDEQFNCLLNGRPDSDYHKLKWKPRACDLPRLNGKHFLELLKGKRLVFVGDSLNRNMWESLVCILKNSVKNPKKVYEAFGRHYFRTGASYSFVFKDYNCTVEFFVAPFLVQQWEFKDEKGEVKETLRLDLVVKDSNQFTNADFLVFNTGHWWTHDKTSKGEDYYQEGSHVYKQLDVVEAFRRAITTWARWVDANVNSHKTHVLFRGYSASHFSGGQWNSGGQCDSETKPIKNESYLTEYPWKMKVFESVIKGMKTPISYLNVTRMTDYRKDGHPSVYRKQHLSDEERRSPLRFQDCSHWCLPGVPDSWNELLYAELLRKLYKDQQQKRNKT